MRHGDPTSSDCTIRQTTVSSTVSIVMARFFISLESRKARDPRLSVYQICMEYNSTGLMPSAHSSLLALRPSSFQTISMIWHMLLIISSWNTVRAADLRLYIRITPSSSLVVNVVPVAFHCLSALPKSRGGTYINHPNPSSPFLKFSNYLCFPSFPRCFFWIVPVVWGFYSPYPHCAISSSGCNEVIGSTTGWCP
jgi:hypothetical protein